MRKITPKFFQELSKKKYLSYAKILPDIKQEKTQTYAALALTILAISFFGMFAISPTISTIAELQKKRDDAQFVDEQLGLKLSNITVLQERYNALSSQLPFILAAIPQDPKESYILGQLREISTQSQVNINKINIEVIELIPLEENIVTEPISSFLINIDAQGEYENLTDFFNALTKFDRILTIDSFTMTRQINADEPLRIVVKARVYYGD